MASQLAEKLRREGMGAMIAPLSFFVDEDVTLPDVAAFDALAFTSRYAVERFAKLSDVRQLPVFVVGSATAEAAHEAGFRDVQPGGSDARDLAQVITVAAGKKNIKRLLHPAGEDVARDLADLLKPAGIAVTRAVLYRAMLADALPPDVAAALKSGHITTIALFSARAARRFAEILQREKMTDLCPQLEMVCLSERIAAEVSVYPWRSVKVSLLQNQESLMDCLRARSQDEHRRQVMGAEVVLRAFGGIRPLSSRLGITPSTVQGWKERGTIPETRINDILSAALKNGIDLDMLWDKPSINDAPPSQLRAAVDNGANRRAGQDRRIAPPVLDDKGHVRSTSYHGPDRRSGLDRRAYQQRQQRRMQQEKWRFFNRSILMGALFFILVGYAGVVLMAPELLQGKNPFAAIQKEFERTIDHDVAQIMPVVVSSPAPRGLEGKLNAGIERVEQAAGVVQQQASAIVDNPALVQNFNAAGVQELVQVLSRASGLAQSGGGAALNDMMAQLKGAMLSAPDGKIARQAQIQSARDRNKDLDRVMTGVRSEDLEAAAILLLMNEFRGNVAGGRPFDDDLALAQKIAGDDPELKAALDRLAPAAKKGVLSREGLQKEFKAVAADIVVAKLKGEDATVQQKILERFSRLVKVRRIDQVTGDEVDAVVARAQILLDRGDIDGAVAELQTLKGHSAQAAAPFIDQAVQSSTAAGDSDAVLTRVLQQYQVSGGAPLSDVFGGLLKALGGRADVPYLSPALQR
jgi:uroporphyrinogen-III synthase